MLSLLSLAAHGLASNLELGLPYKLTLAVTYRCNARCKICNIWKLRPRDELSLEEMQRLARSTRFKWINLTGGEPFLRDDLFEIARAFAKSGASVINCTTNGTLVDRVLSFAERVLTELDLARFVIVISIDAPEKLHNELRGIAAWKSAVTCFKRLRELKSEFRSFSCFIGYTISPFNLGKLLDTFVAIRKVVPGLRLSELHVNLMHVSASYYRNLGIRVPRDFYERALEEIEWFVKHRSFNLLSPIGVLEKLYLARVRDFIFKKRCPFPCKALRSSVFIDAFGNVYPCVQWGEKLGNLRSVDFRLARILRSEKARRMRKLISSLHCPQCWTPCEAYQTIIGNAIRWIV